MLKQIINRDPPKDPEPPQRPRLKNFLDSSVTIWGTLWSRGDLIIDGQLFGSLVGEGLTIGENATIVGNLLGREVVHFGQFFGRAAASKSLELKMHSEFHGSLVCATGGITVESGGSLSLRPNGIDARVRDLASRSRPDPVALFAEPRPVRSKVILSHDATIDGTLQSSDEIIMDGKLRKGMLLANRLVIGENAEILGDCIANSAVVFGKVTGTLTIRGECSVKSASRISGSIRAGSLSIEEGTRLTSSTHHLSESAFQDHVAAWQRHDSASAPGA